MLFHYYIIQINIAVRRMMATNIKLSFERPTDYKPDSHEWVLSALTKL
jgi:hypothetical protein